ncbi:MAG TPA: hypothetical protein VF371_06790, partial [Candidatus Limnocylindrales bacterium]
GSTIDRPRERMTRPGSRARLAEGGGDGREAPIAGEQAPQPDNDASSSVGSGGGRSGGETGD